MEELLASSWWRSGTLLNTPQCTRQPHIKNDLAPNTNSVKVDESCKKHHAGIHSFSQCPQYRYMHTPMHTLSHTVLCSHTHILDLEERLYDETKG